MEVQVRGAAVGEGVGRVDARFCVSERAVGHVMEAQIRFGCTRSGGDLCQITDSAPIFKANQEALESHPGPARPPIDPIVLAMMSALSLLYTWGKGGRGERVQKKFPRTNTWSWDPLDGHHCNRHSHGVGTLWASW
eukprot:1161840-Pelagomonas_calceolata.AAC.17